VRLAFVSPLPPAPTGIADYSADLLSLLAPRHALDLFHGQESVDASRLPPGCAVLPAAQLPERHGRQPYDVIVHQLGNAAAHAFQYDLLSRAPGLLVLHDLVLFHSRAALFLDSEPVRAWRRDPASEAAREAARPALAAWRAELVYSYPAEGNRLFEAHLGTVGDLLPYAYPLFRIPVEASRAVATHGPFAADAVRAEVAGASVFEVPMPAQATPVDPAAVRSLRQRLGLADDDFVIASFGLVTREKRIDTVARAVARAGRKTRARLLLVGPVGEGSTLQATLARAGVTERTLVAGRVPLAQLPLYMEAADLVAHLRYPGGGETSAALLRVLAQGRPTVVSELEQQREIPDDAVRRLDPLGEEEDLERVILELAGDPAARHRLGAAAAAHVRQCHGPAAVVAAWEKALEATRVLPDRPAHEWPAHWPRAAGGAVSS
jgi:glycosyltransferase involved in cell wall biosynthesis